MDSEHIDRPSADPDATTLNNLLQALTAQKPWTGEKYDDPWTGAQYEASVAFAQSLTRKPADLHSFSDEYADLEYDDSDPDHLQGEHPLPYDTPTHVGLESHVQEALGLWQESAVGNSTRDYCLHDCLFSGLLRDSRAWWFRIVTASDPHPAVRVRCLHQRQLYKLAQARTSGLSEHLKFPEDAEHYARAQRLIKKLDRLWICPPCRVSYSYLGQRQPRYCRRLWLCPWCNARAAYDLYAHIVPIAEQEMSSTGRVPAVLCLETSDQHCEGVDFTVDHVLAAFRRVLWNTAQRLGATGGLMISSVSRPDCDVYSYTVGFLRAFYLVCLIDPDCDTFDLTMEHACNPKLDPCGHPILVGRYLSDSSSCATMLRKLMFGSDRSWEHGSAIETNEEDPYHSLHQWPTGGGAGCGAACLPAVCQFQRVDWFAYEGTTHNRSRFTLLGTWQKPKLPDPTEALMPTPERLEFLRQAQAQHAAKVRQRRPLDAENQLRQQEALIRRQGLLAVIQPHWDQITAHAREGKLPSRRLDRIVQYLRITGLSVSDRDARWLSQQLPPE